MKKTVVIIHKDRVLHRTEDSLKEIYETETLDQAINEIIFNCRYFNTSPTIIIQGKTIEKIIKVK